MPVVRFVAVKLCRFVKPVPLVLTANTVPLPELPPNVAVVGGENCVGARNC